MRVFWMILGVVCGLGVALDAFQTIVLPRRPKGRFRITRLFYITTWTPWMLLGQALPSRRLRDQFFSIYAPFSLLLLLVFWAMLLILAFALVYFALGTPFAVSTTEAGARAQGFATDLYVSGTTLFTLGLGDVVPRTYLARALLVIESGTGLGFVALVIGYLPVIYQAFSHREVSVAMLDGRAGSPPAAAELLQRFGYEGGERDLINLLAEWERWSAEILETHISYPILCYYRSQHDNQSWLSALVAVLDACALLITTVDGPQARQAQLTFATGRHALIDLGHVFELEASALSCARAVEDRLPEKVFARLCGALGDTHLRLCGDPAARARLDKIRHLYEPYAEALAGYLKMDLPAWMPEAKKADSWKTVLALRMGATAGEPAVETLLHTSPGAVDLHDRDHGF